ncbi:unnamed protein product [Ectocarpus fasciculatus]
MESDGVVPASADPSPSLGEVPAVAQETIGGSDEQEDPAAVVDEEGDDRPAAEEEDGEGEGISDDEKASGRRRAKGGEQEEGEEEGERAVKESPYEYPTGVVEIEDQELAPAGNLYESWTATPGVTGEALDNVTLTLKFEAMGAQDLTVGLAHKSGGTGGMYQLIIGNKGNLQVDLEKKKTGGATWRNRGIVGGAPLRFQEGTPVLGRGEERQARLRGGGCLRTAHRAIVPGHGLPH